MNKISQYLIANSIFFNYVNAQNFDNPAAMAFLIPVLDAKQGGDLVDIAESEGLSMSVNRGLIIKEKIAVKKASVKKEKKK